jgi:protein KTI12
MPLVLMCGLPSSGKTNRTNELKEYFEKHSDKTVYIINDMNFNIDKNIYYSGKRFIF